MNFQKFLLCLFLIFLRKWIKPLLQSHSVSSGVAEEAPAFEHEKMSSRETLEMMRAYYRITDPQVRKKVFELIKSLADDKPVE